MEFLLSNISPIRSSNKDFPSIFEQLIQEADKLKIAVGYISTDSLTELKKIVEMKKNFTLELSIGMHYFDGITRTQFEAAHYLNNFLVENKAGIVNVINAFRFHGKLYSFNKNNKSFAGIIGSSNLDSILDSHHDFETDMLVDDDRKSREIGLFIDEISQKATIPFSFWKVTNFIENNRILEKHDRVEKCDNQMVDALRRKHRKISFKLPIKGDKAQQSNLNAYFGKGRTNQRGFVKPRHWYEVELIVPKKITSDKNYPKAGYPKTESVITVYTDDGWKFNCKISGQNSKNFRSEDDLKILGKWIKGRLENAGCLQIGEPVTDNTLEKYGRDDVELISTDDPNIWLLDFGVTND